MLRKLRLLLIIILIFSCLIACGIKIKTLTLQKEPVNISDMRGFCSNYAIYVDEETDVMYLLSNNDFAGGLTTMLNADGTPKLREQTNYNTIKISEMKRFCSNYEIFVDEETDVMYIFSSNGFAGGLTIMLNADGTPKLSDGTKYDTIKISNMEDLNLYHEIYVDEETDVMYLFLRNNYGGGLTTMLNADGTPKLSDGTKYDTIKISNMDGLTSYCKIHEDEETRAMYLFSKNSYSGGLTTMLNANGTPKLSDETKYDTIKISDMRGFRSYSRIYVDEETGVKYLFSRNGYCGGLTTMINKGNLETK